MDSSPPRPCTYDSLPPGARGRAVAEVGALVCGVAAIMWLEPLVPYPRQTQIVGIALLVVLLVWCRSRETAGRREIGLRRDNFLLVLGRLAPWVGGFVVVVTGIGWSTHSLHFGERFWSMLASVPLWALLQQYLLLGFAHRRLRLVIGGPPRARLVTAALFGVMHLPNPTLVVVCTLGGYIWAREYDRSPNLYAHALTHAIASAFLANTLPPFLLKSMAVGFHYLR